MTLLIRGVPLLAVLLVLVFPAWGEDARGVGVVTALTGQADLKRPQVPEALLKLRDNLFVRDVVDTHVHSLARVLLMGKSSITVRELSRFEIREETRPDGAQRAIINLTSGKIRVMVARRLMKPGDEVQIRTPNAIAGVRGSDGIFEVTTLPDGRPQTSLLVASGEFEVTTPSTRPIAMAEVVSDAASGIRLAQAAGPNVVGAGNWWIATGPPGFQQVMRRPAGDAEIRGAIQGFRGSSVASGTGAQNAPVTGAAETAAAATAESQALIALAGGAESPSSISREQRLIPEGKENLGQVVSQYILNGKTSTLSGIFNVLDLLADTNGRRGLGLGRLCAKGACAGSPPGPGGGPPGGGPTGGGPGGGPAGVGPPGGGSPGG